MSIEPEKIVDVEKVLALYKQMQSAINGETHDTIKIRQEDLDNLRQLCYEFLNRSDGPNKPVGA